MKNLIDEYLEFQETWIPKVGDTIGILHDVDITDPKDETETINVISKVYPVKILKRTKKKGLYYYDYQYQESKVIYKDQEYNPELMKYDWVLIK